MHAKCLLIQADLDLLPTPDVSDKIAAHVYASLIGELLSTSVNTVLNFADDDDCFYYFQQYFSTLD